MSIRDLHSFNSNMDREQGGYVHNRRVVENTIEELIGLLDQIDEDPDLEDDGTAEDGDTAEEDDPGEPSLASPERSPSVGWGSGYSTDTRSSQTNWTAGSSSDREVADDTEESCPLDEHGELDQSDAEPDLEDGDGDFVGGDRLGADEKEAASAEIEALTFVRGPSRLARRPLERSRPGWCNVTIVGPAWWR